MDDMPDTDSPVPYVILITLGFIALFIGFIMSDYNDKVLKAQCGCQEVCNGTWYNRSMEACFVICNCNPMWNALNITASDAH